MPSEPLMKGYEEAFGVMWWCLTCRVCLSASVGSVLVIAILLPAQNEVGRPALGLSGLGLSTGCLGRRLYNCGNSADARLG